MTGDIQLRDVQESDLPVFFEHQQDPVANRLAAVPARDEKSFYSHWEQILVNEGVIKQTILFKGEVAGNIVCLVQEEEVNVIYWLGREYWGKGIATAAVCEFLGIIDQRPLIAHVSKNNPAAIKVLEKCGFEKSAEGEEEYTLKLE